jgi:hypothetical protein
MLEWSWYGIIQLMAKTLSGRVNEDLAEDTLATLRSGSKVTLLICIRRSWCREQKRICA